MNKKIIIIPAMLILIASLAAFFYNDPGKQRVVQKPDSYFYNKIISKINLNNQHIIYKDFNLSMGYEHVGQKWDLWLINKNNWKKTVIKVYGGAKIPTGSFQAFIGNRVYLFESATKTLVEKQNQKDILPADFILIMARFANDYKIKKIKNCFETELEDKKAYYCSTVKKEKIRTEEGKDKVILSKEKYWVDKNGGLRVYKKYYENKLYRLIEILSQKTVIKVSPKDISVKAKYNTSRIEKE